MQKETKNEVMACFNAWKEEKGQKALCTDQMKVQVDDAALKLCDNPGDKEELKKNKKKVGRLFTYLASDDEPVDPYEMAQLIDEFK